MRQLTLTFFLTLSFVFWPIAAARALETDQFTVPDKPLPDLSMDLDLKIDLDLRVLINDANDHLAQGGHEAQKYRENDYFALALDKMYANGIPECTIERWIRYTDFGKPDARFDVGILSSVYGRALIGRPITLFTLAPTINLYGHYVGTDKVGHFFQQGYEYYETFRKSQLAGKTDQDAVHDAVLRGIAQEQGIYGMFIVDVYSNADLSANIAGFMFYRNLTQLVRLPDGTVLLPMLVLRNGRWELNAMAGDHHLKAYVCDNWDESMNPCDYAPMLRHIVQDNLRDLGARWVAFHHTTRERETQRLAEMTTWHGIHYGHSDSKELVTIVNHYYDVVDHTAFASKR
ncbi:MAG TPA: hypothetical protein VFE58_08295 [Tepidisphaeraceae bacterium]|jgi:hypothetical protein|nr:hypothetical protein [Tepidisphaeraceae bacterium]